MTRLMYLPGTPAAAELDAFEGYPSELGRAVAFFKARAAGLTLKIRVVETTQSGPTKGLFWAASYSYQNDTPIPRTDSWDHYATQADVDAWYRAALGAPFDDELQARRRRRADGYYWVYDTENEDWMILEWVNYADPEDSDWFPYSTRTKKPWDEESFIQIEGPIQPPRLAHT